MSGGRFCKRLYALRTGGNCAQVVQVMAWRPGSMRMTRDSRRRLQQYGDVHECFARQVLVALEEAQGGLARCEHFEVD